MPAKGYRKPDRDRRDTCFTFWVTRAEREAIRENAARAGLSPSAFVRTLALGRPVTPKPRKGAAPELIRQLSRLANNLVQLLRHAEVGILPDPAPVEAVHLRVMTALRHWASDSAARAIAPELIAEIVHQGALLNQLTRSANQGQGLDPVMVDTVLSGLREAVRPVGPDPLPAAGDTEEASSA
jgi:Mobilization protein NikA